MNDDDNIFKALDSDAKLREIVGLGSAEEAKAFYDSFPRDNWKLRRFKHVFKSFFTWRFWRILISQYVEFSIFQWRYGREAATIQDHPKVLDPDHRMRMEIDQKLRAWTVAVRFVEKYQFQMDVEPAMQFAVDYHKHGWRFTFYYSNPDKFHFHF